MNTISKFLLVGLAVVGLAGLALQTTGCGDDDNPPAIQAQKSAIRVIHLSPDAPGVDVFVNGESRVIEDLKFGEGTGYLEVESGTYSFNVSASGAPASESVLDIDGIALGADRFYTAVAYNNLGSIEALALEDDFSNLATDSIRVRAIHAAPAVGQVDIWNIPVTGEPSILYENVDFGVVGNYLDLPAGAYTLGFDVDDDMQPDLTFSLPELSAGVIANVFAVNDTGGSVQLTAQLQDSTLARIDGEVVMPEKTEIRVLHLSPDAPAVDVWVNGSLEAVSGLAFGEGTGYIELDSGSYDVGIAPAGTSASDSVLEISNLALEPDTRYTAVAFDQLSNIQALALVDDYSALDSGSIRVRPVHTASGVGQVDIWYLPEGSDAILLYENVDFGAVGNYIDLPAGSYTLGFDVDDDASPDAIFRIPELAAGTVANVFAVLDSGGQLSLRAQLNSGDVAQVIPATARLRAIHLSPDAPAVDIYYNDKPSALVEGLPFEQGTGYVEVLPGLYNFHVTPSGGQVDDAVLHLHGFDLMDGYSYTAVAFDTVTSIQGLFLEDDFDGMESGNLRVRAIHTAPGVGQVDIWALFESAEPALLYENVDFGVVGGYLDLPADSYTLGFDVNDDATPDVVFELPALPAGTVANVFAVNDSGGSVFLLAQLEDGTLARINPAM